MASLYRRAKVKYFNFHALRHFGASRFAEKGVGLTDIQAFLGHERVTTTDLYLQAVSKSVRHAVEYLDI